MEQVTDRLETLIIMAMDARHGDFGAQAIRRGRSTEGTYKLVDAGEILKPVPLDDYKNVFADRDGPMTGARRKAIIHWVATHLRHSTRGLEYEVKRHTRGVQEFTIDGLRIRLTPNDTGNGPRQAALAEGPR